VKDFWPSSLVDQNFFMLCSMVPVACTVTVSPLATVGPLPARRVCGRGGEEGEEGEEEGGVSHLDTSGERAGRD